MIVAEILTAAAGAVAAAAPAALLLRRMHADLDAARTACAVARHDAAHDRLTGLVNRAGLETALNERADNGRPWSLIMVDLDDFKQVNDTFGHAAGDEVLVEAARRLSMAFAETGDVVGRFGGDEFLVVADSPEHQASSLVPWMRALHALKALRQPMELESGHRVTVTASVGLVQVLPDASLRRALRSADMAVYRGKVRGGNQLVEYGLPGELAALEPERPVARLREMTGAGRDLWAVRR
ncbi:diguanylate cyclase (GGDEF)-like protein [Krasilnikovia cinnamomea]|uniref:Diguanylate cyclase (GGDEF)-like protein n=1 Tax=Krasilnikovia cinnamomea TaxID=349313 RepID=A0A4Q7Z7S0_9ACTN|nr:GGDEF domain-containing protein [Krasilnikovia cinnamomea]RZU46537.1 diguanylate cyclase (GGDEF)-like protein [Krasilnikovia cinnamomea]